MKARKDFRANAVFSPLLMTDAHGRVDGHGEDARQPHALPHRRARDGEHALLRQGRERTSSRSASSTRARRAAVPHPGRHVLAAGRRAEPRRAAARTIDVAVRAANLDRPRPRGQARRRPGRPARRGAIRLRDEGAREGGDPDHRDLRRRSPTRRTSSCRSTSRRPPSRSRPTARVDDKPRFEQLDVPAGIFARCRRRRGASSRRRSCSRSPTRTGISTRIRTSAPSSARRACSPPRRCTTSSTSSRRPAGRPARRSRRNATSDLRVLAKDQIADGGWGYFRGMQVRSVRDDAGAAGAGGGPKTGGDGHARRRSAFVSGKSAQLVAELERAAALPAVRARDRDRLSIVVALAADGADGARRGRRARCARAERLHALATKLGSVSDRRQGAPACPWSRRQERDRAMRDKRSAEQILAAVHETASAATVDRALRRERAPAAGLEQQDLRARARRAHARDAPTSRSSPSSRAVCSTGSATDAGCLRRRTWSRCRRCAATSTLFEKDTPTSPASSGSARPPTPSRRSSAAATPAAAAALGWDALAPGSSHDVALEKSGAGRMYYRVGISVRAERDRPARRSTPASSCGAATRRSTIRATSRSWPTDAGRSASARKVLVTLEAINTTHRYQVALVDPLPAGLETVNDAPRHRANAARTEHDARWDFTEHARQPQRGLRHADGRRAATGSRTPCAPRRPGTFLAAPAKAEEMYSPETFGRSAGETVVIE